jgi:cation transport regulator ChaC
MILFAYASLMNPGQMSERSPGARTIGVARLVDYCLCFPQASRTHAGAAAGIEPRTGNAVWGVLYDIPEGDVPVLNYHEGYEPNGRAGADRHVLREVTVLRIGGSDPVKAMAYFAMPDGTHAAPSSAYMDLIIDGALYHGLPKAYVAALERVPTR